MYEPETQADHESGALTDTAEVAASRPVRILRLGADRACTVVDVVWEVLLTATVVAAFIISMASIISRDLLHHSLTWQLDATQLAISIFTFIGGAFALRLGRHASVRFAYERMPASWREGHPAFVHFVVGAISLLIGYLTLGLLGQSWSVRSPVLGLPQTLYILPLTLGAFSLALYALRELVHLSPRVLIKGGIAVAVLFVAVYLFDLHASGTAVSSVATLGSFFVLLLLGIPVAFVLLSSAALYLLFSHAGPVSVVTTNMVSGVSNEIYLAVVFFILAGFLMSRAGLSGYLVRFMALTVRRIPGGLLMGVVASMYLFSGISGSKVADVSAVGAPVVESVEEHGYTRSEVASVLAAAAVMGEAVPPSIVMIILSSVTTISAVTLMLGGIIPALLVGILLCVSIGVQFRRRRQAFEPVPARTRIRMGLLAAPTLLVPGILVIGIGGGFISPTEASSVAVAISLVLALAYRQYTVKGLRETIRESVATTGLVMLIISSASSFSYSLTVAGLPAALSSVFTSAGSSRLLFIAVTIIAVPILGTMLEGAPAVLVFGPIMVPIATTIGINPIQYGIIFVIALGLGTFAPPLGAGLYATCSVCGTTIEAVAKLLVRYWLVIVVALVILAAVPAITTFLPHALGH